MAFDENIRQVISWSPPTTTTRINLWTKAVCAASKKVSSSSRLIFPRIFLLDPPPFKRVEFRSRRRIPTATLKICCAVVHQLRSTLMETMKRERPLPILNRKERTTRIWMGNQRVVVEKKSFYFQSVYRIHRNKDTWYTRYKLNDLSAKWQYLPFKVSAVFLQC